MISRNRILAGIATVVLLGGSVVYAQGPPSEPGLCNGLGEAIARSSGLAKLILQVIAGFFGCGVD
jgi:hypothetical protein